MSTTVLKLRALQRGMETAEETVGTIWCPSSKLCFVFIQLKSRGGWHSFRQEHAWERKTSTPEAYFSFICSPAPISLSPQGLVWEGKSSPPLPTPLVSCSFSLVLSPSSKPRFDSSQFAIKEQISMFSCLHNST